MSKTKPVSRNIVSMYLSDSTKNEIDRICRSTGEARGRVIDAMITHQTGCICSICSLHINRSKDKS